jgi:hypothetical protein
MSQDNYQVRKIKLITDNQSVNSSVYRFKLFFKNQQKVPFKYECKKRKEESIERLGYAVYLTSTLWESLEKRVCGLVSIEQIPLEEDELTLGLNETNVPKNKQSDYEIIKKLIAEYYPTSLTLLGLILSSRHIFPKSRVVYFDSKKKLFRHSGFIEGAEELK